MWVESTFQNEAHYISWNFEITQPTQLERNNNSFMPLQIVIGKGKIERTQSI